MKIYIVNGSCGEYSDRQEWQICAYESEHLAKSHVEGAEDFTRRHAIDPHEEREDKKPPNPYDPKGYYDHWDTPRYWYCEIELKSCH